MSDTSDSEQLTARIDLIHNALQQGDSAAVERLLQEMYPAEIALVLEALPKSERHTLWDLTHPDDDGEILTHLSETLRASLMDRMDQDELLAATGKLDSDDLADLLPELPDEVIQQLLLSMDEENRQRLEALLPYPEDTAGGLMNADPITVRADITLEVVLRYLRRLGKMPEMTDSLMVINRQGIYLGLLPLTTLLTNDPRIQVARLMDREIEGILATTPAEEVANLFDRRDLVSAPVINEEGKLLGRITIDDVVDVIRETADHSLRSMAGLDEQDDIFAPVVESSRRRGLWLGINLVTALMVATVIGLFEATIEQLVALAVLMPIVASMGGIAGSQTLTLVIRAQALGQISPGNSGRLLRKELAVGALNGIVWASVIAAVASLWFDNLILGGVIGAAIIINLTMAALLGAAIPLLLKRLGADPALAGPVALTTFTDVIGFFAFLGLATLILV
jgi:magnesium transporter